jgi:hypothetical protein
MSAAVTGVLPGMVGPSEPQLAVEVFAEERWKHRYWMERVTQHMHEGRPRQGAEIGRRSFGQGGPEMMAANFLILAMPRPKILDEAAERRVGGDASVQLMERSFPEQGDGL